MTPQMSAMMEERVYTKMCVCDDLTSVMAGKLVSPPKDLLIHLTLQLKDDDSTHTYLCV